MKTSHQSKFVILTLVDALVKEFEDEFGSYRHKCISKNGRYIYHIAMIDYLQAYDIEKQAENFLKIWLYQRDGNLISAAHPNLYAHRFNKFMREQVVINQTDVEGGRASFQ